MEEKNIKFDMPETIDQIEAVGAFYKALFNLGVAYGCNEPGLLIDKTKWSMEYELSQHLKKQNAAIEAAAAEEAKIKEAESATDEQESTDEEDKPIDLSELNF